MAETKLCNHCKVEQPLDSFYFHKSGRRQSACKECLKAYTRDYYLANKERIIARNAVYEKEKGRFLKKAPVPKDKERARWKVKHEVRMGRIKKLSCVDCSNTKTEFHHTEGYSEDKWFTGVWLCRTHHSEAHRKMRSEKYRVKSYNPIRTKKEQYA